MKRVHVHLAFAGVSLALAVVAGLQYGFMRSKAEVNGTLAEASVMADGGELDAAEPLLAELARDRGGDAVGQAARFHLGNAYLREALRGDIDPRRRRPLAELAKERYRELLRIAPDHWDARYNLERALRLAPERVATNVDAGENPLFRVDVVVPDFEPRDLP